MQALHRKLVFGKNDTLIDAPGHVSALCTLRDGCKPAVALAVALMEAGREGLVKKTASLKIKDKGGSKVNTCGFPVAVEAFVSKSVVGAGRLHPTLSYLYFPLALRF
jgi:hypothetical protein